MSITSELSDLDELILSCRSANAKVYIGEAVSCYKSGAFRSAIVSTWVAVVYDFLDKLRELEMTSDPNARTRIENFEKWRQSNNWKAALEFERDVIRLARDEFELLSHPQGEDLERLASDRNRCAHPSMISAEEPYQPTAELARTHIKNAVIHLLSHPPVQGKAALDRIMNDVSSEYFPNSASQAVSFLRAGPLARARKPLVRNLVLLLSKELLLKGWNNSDRKRRYSALAAILEMYRDVSEAALKEAMALIREVPDDKLYRAIFYLANIPLAWDLMDPSGRIRASTYVEKSEESLERFLHYAIRVPALRNKTIARLSDASVEIFGKVIAAAPSIEFVDRAIAKFKKAGSFRQAESLFASLILPLADVLRAEDVSRVLDAFLENGQITYAAAIPEMYLELFNQTERFSRETKEDWKKVAAEIGNTEAAKTLQTAILERYK